ncbi:unnamed protein product, partial [Adineta steineri]
ILEIPKLPIDRARQVLFGTLLGIVGTPP